MGTVAALGLLLLSFAQTPASLLQQGARALGTGHAREALRLGEALVVKYPQRYEGYRLVGRSSMSLDDPKRAEAAFRTALKLAPVKLRPSIQDEILGATALSKALAELARVEKLKGFGDLVGAARAQEAAYDAYPARAKYGLAAVDLYESANRYADARRILERITVRHPKLGIAEKIAALETKAQTARAKAASEEAERHEQERQDAETRRAEKARRDEEAQKAKAAQEREAQRRADEQRNRLEKERQEREEADRLRQVLIDNRAGAAQAEAAISSADAVYTDADRIVRRIDGDADDARNKRDRAKRKRDDLADKLRDAKGELARQVLKDDLRTAQRDYDEAKDDFDRVNQKLTDAKSRRDSAQADGDRARTILEQSRQAIRDTESALARLSGG